MPTNGIWFKPMAPGPSIISFSISNKGGGEKYRSIYRFKRENGVITSWTETKLVFNSSFANCDIIAFEFYIDQLDVDEEYEYLIGTSRNDNNDSAVSFVFLALAGASDTGGGEDTPVSRPTEPGTFAEIMYDVDYVISPTVDISADTYENHQTLLRIDAAVGGSKLYYLAAGELGSSRVYYTLPTGCQITDISSGKMSATVGKNETFAGKNFEEREEIKDENSP